MAESRYICEVINTEKTAKSLLLDILEKNEVIAVDMEFRMDEKRPCIIQIHVYTSMKIYLLDITVCPQIMLLPSLKSVMESSSIKKVFHGGTNDSSILWDHVYLNGDNSKKIQLKNVDDIQLMTQARDQIQRAKTISPKGLVDICQEYGIAFPDPQGKDLRKNDYKWFGNRNNNEMPIELLKYAANDVSVIFSVYGKIHEQRFMKNAKIKEKYDELLFTNIFARYEPGYRPKWQVKRENWMKKMKERKAIAKRRRRRYYPRKAKERLQTKQSKA